MNHRIIAFALLFLALSGIADAIDITTCSDLNTTNGVYTLTADITPGESVCFNFTANNVTLDCQGHSVNIDGTEVLIDSFNDSTIKNCDFGTGSLEASAPNTYGLNATNVTNLTINNTMISCVSLTGVVGALVNNTNITGSGCENEYTLSLNTTNSSIFANNNISSLVIGDGAAAGISFYIDNESYGNFVYNNFFFVGFTGGPADDCFVAAIGNVYYSMDDTASSNNYFNTTRQVGARIYGAGAEIGGNYYQRDCEAFGEGIKGFSALCTDANTDGFCDLPLRTSGTDYICSGTTNCTWLIGEDNCTDFSTWIANPLCSWVGGGPCHLADTCGDFGNETCGCTDLGTQDECWNQTGCSWGLSMNGTGVIDYLPLSNKANIFTMRGYDESTGARIYFTATIVNSTNTTNTGYQYYYQATPSSIANGAVSIVVSNTTYYQSKYVGTIPANGVSNLDAYLQPLSNLNVKQVSFLTTSASSQALPGVLVSINRLVNGNLVSVGQAYTDSTGMASFFMDSTVSYTVTASMLGYSTVTQTIMPTQTTYTITMGNWTIGMFHQTFYDIQWTFAPTGILDENKTHNLTFSTFSSTGKIVWFAWKIYNDTTLLRFENNTNTMGGTVNYSVLPGPNSNITVYFYIMRANMSEQQLAIWWMPLPVQSFINQIIGDINKYIASNQTLTSVLKNLGNQANNWRAFPNAISSFTLVLGTLIVGVITSAWVGRFSPTGGQLVFVIVMAVGTYMGAGLLASVSLLIFIIFVAVAYQLWRSGG